MSYLLGKTNPSSDSFFLADALANDPCKVQGELTFALGRDTHGEIAYCDLTTAPNMLVVGSSGSGKSEFLHGVLHCLMHNYTPEQVRFAVVDPKTVEFSRYAGSPYLLTEKVITTYADTLGILEYLNVEMQRRFDILRHSKTANVKEYNAVSAEKLPYLVFVIDEFDEFVRPDNKEKFIQRIIRLVPRCRVTGIHLILSSLCADAKVITPFIKSNFPLRVCLRTAYHLDSMVVVGKGGAEYLKTGEMLVSLPFVDDVKHFWAGMVDYDYIDNLPKKQREQYPQVSFVPTSSYHTDIDDSFGNDGQEQVQEQLDPYCRKALRYWLINNGGKASISSLVRALCIGFNRAGHIVAQLQELGYLEAKSPNSVSNLLTVAVTLEQLDELFPNFDD